MCFDADSRPPIEPIAGASIEHRSLVLEAADGNRFAAFEAMAAQPSEHGHAGAAGRARSLRLLRGAGAAFRRGRRERRWPSTTTGGPPGHPVAMPRSSSRHTCLSPPGRGCVPTSPPPPPICGPPWASAGPTRSASASEAVSRCSWQAWTSWAGRRHRLLRLASGTVPQRHAGTADLAQLVQGTRAGAVRRCRCRHLCG